jgi:predicted RNase H-like HicB family nuclease
MKGEFTAIIEEAPEGGYWAICPEVPGANGQGNTLDEAKSSLRDAIKLIFEDRVEDVRRGLPEDAIQTVVAVSTNSSSPRPRRSRKASRFETRGGAGIHRLLRRGSTQTAV